MTIPPFDWQALVDEAKRRRRDRKLTQADHAMRAGVSKPTIVDFDRGATTLSIGKALDILRVVGLADQAANAQDRFVQAAIARWQQKVSAFPADADQSFPHGRFQVDFSILDAEPLDQQSLLPLLTRAVVRTTAWPPFWVPTRPEIAPMAFGGGYETWLGDPDTAITVRDAAHSDYWAVGVDGRALLLRGFQEDGSEQLSTPPGQIFDLTLPIWRVTEILLYAASLASHWPDVATDTHRTRLRLRLRWRGLAGRRLVAWANPDLWDTADDAVPAGVDEVETQVETTPAQIEEQLEGVARDLLLPLYRVFGIDLSADLVASEVSKVGASHNRLMHGARRSNRIMRVEPQQELRRQPLPKGWSRLDQRGAYNKLTQRVRFWLVDVNTDLKTCTVTGKVLSALNEAAGVSASSEEVGFEIHRNAIEYVAALKWDMDKAAKDAHGLPSVNIEIGDLEELRRASGLSDVD